MEITKTIPPGELGSKRHFEKYGDQLVCVRYRVDREKLLRYTTVELIVDTKGMVITTGKKVKIKIHYHETQLRQQIKTTGAKWLTEEKCWE